MRTDEKKLKQDAYDSAVSSALGTGQGTLGEKPVYQGTYDQQVQDLYNRIANREKFNYDMNADPLYQSMKDQKIQTGKLAMKDAMGQAAALTGGYGSSYGQQVGQQTYDAYLQSLSDAIPELYGMALDKYNMEGQDLLTQYGLLGDMRDNEYSRWRTDVADWENERAWQQQMEELAYNRQWNEDERAYSRERDALSDQRYADELAYSRERDRISDDRYADELAYSRERDALSDQRYLDELARLAEETAYNRQWNEEQREYNRERDRLSDERYADELAYNRQQTESNTAYSRQQQAYSNLYAMIRASGYNPTDAELAAAGMTRQAADSLINEYNRGIGGTSSSSGGSSGGGGGSSRSGGSSQSGAPDWWNAMSDAQRRAYQASIGTAADGIWGPNTRAASQAADGLTGTYGGAAASGGNGGNGGMTFNSQREFDAWLRQQVSSGTITQREATDLRDEWSRAVVR